MLLVLQIDYGNAKVEVFCGGNSTLCQAVLTAAWLSRPLATQSTDSQLIAGSYASCISTRKSSPIIHKLISDYDEPALLAILQRSPTLLGVLQV